MLNEFLLIPFYFNIWESLVWANSGIRYFLAVIGLVFLSVSFIEKLYLYRTKIYIESPGETVYLYLCY